MVLYGLFSSWDRTPGPTTRPHPCLRWSPLIKRTQIFLALGVVQLLLAGAALAYFVYLKRNANTAESVGLAVNKAISKQQQSTADLRLLRPASSSFTAKRWCLPNKHRSSEAHSQSLPAFSDQTKHPNRLNRLTVCITAPGRALNPERYRMPKTHPTLPRYGTDPVQVPLRFLRQSGAS